MVNFGKVLFLTAAVAAAEICFAESPDWVLKDGSLGRAGRVIEVLDGFGLIKIDTGLQGNLRRGAVCRVVGKDGSVRKVVVVEADGRKSVAMVMSDIKVEKGDAVYITLAN